MKHNVIKMISLLQEKIVREQEIKIQETNAFKKLWQEGFVAGLQDARDIILSNSEY